MYITSMENAFCIKGKNAIVTGGNKGIGEGIATAFAQAGANVAIFARDAASGAKVVEELGQFGGKYKFYQVDIGSMESCKAAVEGVVADFGGIDILVNNAGVGTVGNLLDQTDELKDWFKCLDIDLSGAVRMMYLVGKHMRDSGKGGRIVNITSNAGEVASKTVNMTFYCSAKAGLNHFTKAIALEFAPYGIRVNAIAPGYTYSNLLANMAPEVQEIMQKTIPVGRFGRPLEIGALATFLASPASDDITGAVITIDGGHSLAI